MLVNNPYFCLLRHGVYAHTDAITKKDVTKRVER